MPDLSRCKNVKGKLCCWDKEIERFVEVTINLILDPAFHKEVVAAFMEEDTGECENG